jgi:hypothetical protein
MAVTRSVGLVWFRQRYAHLILRGHQTTYKRRQFWDVWTLAVCRLVHLVEVLLHAHQLVV